MSDRPATLAELLAAAPAPHRGALPAVVGAGAGGPAHLDLVADGPHAVVAGVTGSGKSELLITWVLALCATHSTSQVGFLLADFKGGTAFDSLAGLPHVTGVITDLDGSGARRAIESLRAEVRWREAELGRVGARDVLDERADLPRLVIVVDEFAALLGDHPELHAVFSDIAARGRALGMHLVLGTQRVSGVVRDALLANCPLRLSLRVTDPADSRAVIGTPDAAALPGGREGAGIALVRRAQDAEPRRVRIALSTPADVQRIARDHAGPRPRRPWLPDLPPHVELAQLRAHGGPGLILGLADEPERQHQGPFSLEVADRGVLVVGGPGSGKSTALETLAAQAPHGLVRVPRDPEGAWDAVARLCEDPPAAGSVLVIDDLDALTARLPGDYAHALVERLERVVRGAGDAGIFVAASAQRMAGAAARLGDLVPWRLVLAAPSRAEHVALGGDPAHYAPGAPAGRGRIAGRALQVAVGEDPVPAPPAALAEWTPSSGVTGIVIRRAAARVAVERWRTAGVGILTLEEVALSPDPAPSAAAAPVVVVGDPEDWQRHWRVLGTIRDDHALVIDAGCSAEYRVLAADRELPPYCEPGRSRGWLIRAGGAPERIGLPIARRDAGGGGN
nr:FtsK/SpoIIIE domain-containing protein [Microbacterium ulmi]